MPKGYIKSWRRDRGFGFINVTDQENDIFVHISELRSLGRPPRVGDEISFDIEAQDNGKMRAINCSVKEGQAKPKSRPESASNNPNNTSKLPTIIGVLVIAILCIAGLYFVLE